MSAQIGGVVTNQDCLLADFQIGLASGIITGAFDLVLDGPWFLAPLVGVFVFAQLVVTGWLGRWDANR